MNTKLLTVKEAKKGMTIFHVCNWNFFHGQKRSEDHHRDERGRSVYTPYSGDIYSITEWTIHSCGKSLLRVCDKDGMKKRMGGYANKEGTYGWYVTSHELALELITELVSMDQYSTADIKIEYHRV